jgi:hypothetical protein
MFGDPTYADAILNRLLHNTHRIELSGDGVRKRRKAEARQPATPPPLCQVVHDTVRGPSAVEHGGRSVACRQARSRRALRRLPRLAALTGLVGQAVRHRPLDAKVRPPASKPKALP